MPPPTRAFHLALAVLAALLCAAAVPAAEPSAPVQVVERLHATLPVRHFA